MPVLIGMVFRVVFEALRIFRKKVRESKPSPLCLDCIHAHVQYGTNARRAISCTYSGAVREMKLDVLYCTDYRVRTAPQERVRAIGFVREIVPAE